MDVWAEIRAVLNETIVPYMTKKEDVNRERMRLKERTVNWLMEQLKNGPIKGGVRGNSEMTEIPDFAYHFGSFIWEADRKAILLRDSTCRICGKNPASEVHHIRPKHLKGSWYHPGNLIGLCTECHDEVHRAIDSGIDSVIQSSLEIPINDSQKQLTDWI